MHKLIRYQEEIFSCEGGEALEQFPREVLDVPYLKVFKARLDEQSG